MQFRDPGMDSLFTNMKNQKDADYWQMVDGSRPYIDCAYRSFVSKSFGNETDEAIDERMQEAYETCSSKRASADDAIVALFQKRRIDAHIKDPARFAGIFRAALVVAVIRSAFERQGLQAKFDAYLAGLESTAHK